MLNVSRRGWASAVRAFWRPVARTPEAERFDAHRAFVKRAQANPEHFVSQLYMRGEFAAIDRLLADLEREGEG